MNENEGTSIRHFTEATMDLVVNLIKHASGSLSNDEAILFWSFALSMLAGCMAGQIGDDEALDVLSTVRSASEVAMQLRAGERH